LFVDFCPLVICISHVFNSYFKLDHLVFTSTVHKYFCTLQLQWRAH
jgi:hypothetical protein